MSTLYVSEYTGLGFQSGLGLQIAPEPSTVDQTVSFTGTAGVSAAFAATTRVIRVHTDGICSIRVGKTPTAVTTDKRMIAGQTEYFSVQPSDKISAVTNT